MHSLDDTISELVETFSAWNRCFSVPEVTTWAEDAVASHALRQALLSDARLIALGPSGWGTEYFLPKQTALQWWSDFIVRLAHIGMSRLHERQLAVAMNSLYRFTLWATPPPALVELGQRHGFVAPAWCPGFYVFPIAHLLSQITILDLRHGTQVQLGLWPEEDMTIHEAVDSLLCEFGERVSYVVKVREGLPPCEKATLEELGSTYGVTRERIRQIEKRFWRGLRHAQRRKSLCRIGNSLVNLIRESGCLALSDDEEPAPYVLFAAKCLGIPYVHTKAGSWVVLGSSINAERSWISELGLTNVQSNVEQVARLLDSGPYSFLDHNAILQVARAITNDAYNKLTKQEKVYLVLKHIGKSAHYSEVARVYNQMYPEDRMTEHNIHAILSRCASPDLELYGIVYVGAKGTYGLKEHGYHRPSMSLFDTVTKIVEEKYTITTRPVPINVVASELGKYRGEVNPASLAFATGMNPDIHQIEKDYFVPMGANGVTDSEDKPSDIDRILRDFREAHTSGSHQ